MCKTTELPLQSLIYRFFHTADKPQYLLCHRGPLVSARNSTLSRLMPVIEDINRSQEGPTVLQYNSPNFHSCN